MHFLNAKLHTIQTNKVSNKAKGKNENRQGCHKRNKFENLKF